MPEKRKGSTPQAAHRQQLGRWGEDTAAAYLIQHGLRELARNVRTPFGEID
ncbi:MAG: hypothetical protein HGB14_07860, partial [Anaerolineaceae bacterium]|nr:hypothetical protein [Anaerolineaceae bacterium]